MSVDIEILFEAFLKSETKLITSQVTSSSMLSLLRTLLKDVGMGLNYMQKGERYEYQLKSLGNMESRGV